MMTDYLFNTNPGVLHPQTEVLTAAFVILAVNILAVFLLKRKREFIKLNKDQRFILKGASKINIFLSAGLLIFVILRIAQVAFLSMRAFPIALCIAMVVIWGISGIKMFKKREVEEVAEVTSDEYSKYLPHKKKK